ncbi:MAG: TetR/AcrR family transcriptional regulator [Dehalococcoidia bacterium]
MIHIAESDIHIVVERHAAILQTAERLFGEKGYRGVSIEEIAKGAGVSKGLVLYHFTSKKALLEHVLRDGMHTLMNTLLIKLNNNAQSDHSARAKIREAVEVYLNVLKSRPDLLRIAFFEGILGEDEGMKDILANFTEEILLRIDMLVQDGIATGEFRPVDSRIAARLLYGMITGLPIQATIKLPLLPDSQMVDEITELFCNGLR